MTQPTQPPAPNSAVCGHCNQPFTLDRPIETAICIPCFLMGHRMNAETCWKCKSANLSPPCPNHGNNILDESSSSGDDESSNDTPYDWWEHICGDAFDDPSRGAIAVVIPDLHLSAYFDESYNHPKGDEPRMYSIACYIAIKEHWDAFRAEWQIKLKEKGLEHHGFHMKDFEYARSRVIADKRDEISSKSPYHEWEKDDFDSFLPELHNIMGAKAPSGLPRLAPFCTNLLAKDFDETRPPELASDPECQSYYTVCVANVMAHIAHWAKQNNYFHPIHYIFASNAEEAGNLARWFDYCWKHRAIATHYRLGKGFSRVPHDMQRASTEPALQAADILAYEFNKSSITWVQRKYSDMHLSELRRSLDSLVQMDHWHFLLRRQDLVELFAEIPEERKRFPV